MPTATSTLPTIPPVEMARLQRNDKYIGRQLHYLQKGVKPPNKQLMMEEKLTRKLLKLWDKIQVKDGVLFRMTRDGSCDVSQILLPLVLGDQVFGVTP